MRSESDRRTPQKDPAGIAATERLIDWRTLESIVHRDPAGRGLASFSFAGAPLDAGQLRAAALHLAQHAGTVGMITGFCAVLDDGVTAETDGPPGALFLARALSALGIDAVLITDSYALPLLKKGCELWKLDRTALVEFPFEDGPTDAAARADNDSRHNTKTDRWIDEFFASPHGQSLTHLIAIERPGPSHTLESLRAQARGGPVPLQRFTREVPAADRDICHNMRGQSINPLTAKTHRLLQWIHEKQLDVATIGIGDGGNELGMGRFAWELLADVGGGVAGRTACRIATDFTLIAGVSDWAAYALALTVARLRGDDRLAHDWHVRGQRELIEVLVRQAGAVDGVTLRREPTVDGLELDVYLQALVDIRRALG